MDLAATILEIKNHGEQMQRMGDAAHSRGLNEKAAAYYARAKVARAGYLLQSNVEVSDPEYCYSVQELLKSATLYGLVQWNLTDPPPC